MRIHLLTPEVVDQIAAGEVVERPAHLIKELIENSLDAGSTEIEVDIDQGGRYVRIKDNGYGINKEDLNLALARHATSKISLSSDIWGLTTYGFRGEALASIAAVSRLQMVSRVQSAKQAHRIQSEFGKLSTVEAIGGDFGTTVVIEDLFANVPARLKFLKSESAEISQMKSTLKALAMAYPKVSFRIRVKSQLLHFWPAQQNLKERVAQVLEQDSMFLGESELEGFKVQAVLCPPHVTTKTNRQIWLFVQGRWVQDRGLQAAVQEAYRSLLMHGEYPIAAVFVSCDPEDVDVNIHPTKSQIKFRDSSKAFRAVLRAVRGPLEAAPWVEQVTSGKIMVEKIKPTVFESQPVNQSFSGGAFERTQYNSKDFSKNQNNFKEQLTTYRPSGGGLSEDRVTPSVGKELTDLDLALFEKPRDVSPQVAKNEVQAKWSSLQILGQAHLTYIVTQSPSGLVFIDQHAAHERVAYEKLMSAWHGGQNDIQNYLVPLVIDLEADQVEAIIKAQKDFEKLGLFIEQMGPQSIAINAAPALVKESSLRAALLKTAAEISDWGGSFAFEKVVSDLCASLACHSVVRAGQALSLEQMKSLLDQMDDFPMSSFCPHGRPVFVEYPFSKLERDFGRIV